jgi:hypothetical protein
MHLRLNKFFVLLTSVLALSFSGCKEDVPEFELEPIEPTLVLDFHLMQDGKEVSLDHPFLDQGELNVNVVAFRFFISNLQLTNQSGETKLISEAEFVDFEPIDETRNNIQWGKAPLFYVEPDTYTKLSFGIGLPAELNSGDPTTYENENPLSTYSFMHWTWATMYRFIILEAKADTTTGTDFDYNILFHTGLDELYREGNEFEFNLELKDFERDTLHFDIDWNTLFYTGNDSIEVKKESVSHTTDTPEEFDLAVRFTNNFIQALSLRDED